MTNTFDPQSLRNRFPSLGLEVNNRPAIYLDGPGGTQTPQEVIDAMGWYLSKRNSNLGGAFQTSQETDRVVAAARAAMSDFFNARQPEEIVFGQNMTSLTFSVSRAISRSWQPGDEVIVTRLDHDANITPWVLAAEDSGASIKWLDFDPADCVLKLERLPELLSERTKLVAVSFASNAVGTIVDVAKVCQMAHDVGALVYVDAVHYSPHNPIDVQALDVDFLVASAYKFFGPHTGILYGKYKLLDRLKAYKVRPAPASPPGKWETGTQSFESLAGVVAAVNYIASIAQEKGGRATEDFVELPNRRQLLRQSMQLIKDYEGGLSRHFLEMATQVAGLTVYGITDVERLSERAPTFAVELAGVTPRSLAKYLGERGIFTWDGHYYAVAVMERLGLLDSGGLLRIGFVHYNTTDEIDCLIEALQQLTER